MFLDVLFYLLSRILRFHRVCKDKEDIPFLLSSILEGQGRIVGLSRASFDLVESVADRKGGRGSAKLEVLGAHLHLFL